VVTEATFDVHIVLNIVVGTEAEPRAAENADGEALAKIVDWEILHKLAKEAVFSAFKPAQLIRVAHLETAAEIWKRLANEYSKTSELKRAQLNTKLPSIQKSPSISMHKYLVSTLTSPPGGEVRVELLDHFELLSREIEFHSTAMSAEVILIDDANHWTPATIGDSQEVKAIASSFNNGNNKRKRQSYPVCFGCRQPECPDSEPDESCHYCHEAGHLTEDCFKVRWQNEQRRTKRTKSSYGK